MKQYIRPEMDIIEVEMQSIMNLSNTNDKTSTGEQMSKYNSDDSWDDED